MIKAIGTSSFVVVTATVVALSAATYAPSLSQALIEKPAPLVRPLSDLHAAAPYITAQGSTSQKVFQLEDPGASHDAWPNVIHRLVELSKLPADHDGEGAAAADPDSVDSALAFVRSLPFFAPKPRVGLDSDGSAVVEFHDTDELGQITFKRDTVIEVFFTHKDMEAVYFEGPLDAEDIQLKFITTFGFPVVA